MSTETMTQDARDSDATASRTAMTAREALLARRVDRAGRKSQISWRVIAADLGMPKADSMLARVAAGRAKPSPRLLLALGLPVPERVVTIPGNCAVVEVCPHCHGVDGMKCGCQRKRAPRRVYRGLVTRIVGAVQCVMCGASAKIDENTRARAIRTLSDAGWTWTDAGPVCPDHRGAE